MQIMRFALRNLWRDLKSGELSVLLLALSVAVLSLTAVGFFTSRVSQGVRAQAAEVLAADLRLESRPQLRQVRFLHHEDPVGPFDEFRGQGDVGVVIRAGRAAFDAGIAREHGLGGRAPEAILAADEKDVHCRGGGRGCAAGAAIRAR